MFTVCSLMMFGHNEKWLNAVEASKECQCFGCCVDRWRWSDARKCVSRIGTKQNMKINSNITRVDMLTVFFFLLQPRSHVYAKAMQSAIIKGHTRCGDNYKAAQMLLINSCKICTCSRTPKRPASHSNRPIIPAHSIYMPFQNHTWSPFFLSYSIFAPFSAVSCVLSMFFFAWRKILAKR